MRQLKIEKSITNRNNMSFEKYLADISKNEMITVEEEVILARKIKEGDEEALNRLVNANLRFVVSVAKQYQSKGMILPDLISEGNIGLIKAAKKFDESRGFKFISYAVWWIRQSIIEALSEKSRIIRIPINQVGVMSKINQAYSRLEQEFERAPTEDEIARELNIDTNKVTLNIDSTKSSISLDSPLGGEEGNSSMMDILEDKGARSSDHTAISDSLRIDLERLLNTLDSKSREIIKLHYGIGYPHPKSLEEIGLQYKLTREGVRQIREKALRKIRKGTKMNILRPYL